MKKLLSLSLSLSSSPLSPRPQPSLLSLPSSCFFVCQTPPFSTPPFPSPTRSWLETERCFLKKFILGSIKKDYRNCLLRNIAKLFCSPPIACSHPPSFPFVLYEPSVLCTTTTVSAAESQATFFPTPRNSPQLLGERGQKRHATPSPPSRAHLFPLLFCSASTRRFSAFRNKAR